MRSATLFILGATVITGPGVAGSSAASETPQSALRSAADGRPASTHPRRAVETFGAGDADTVVCQGLPHVAVGAAELLCEADGALRVTNIGSSGEDGVAVDVGETMFFQVDVASLDAAPPGSSLQLLLDGTKDYGDPQPLGSIELARSDTSWQLQADMAPIGIGDYEVAVFDGDEYVGTFPVGPGEAIEFGANPVGFHFGTGGSTYGIDPGCPEPFSRFWYCRMPDGSYKPGCPAFFSSTLFGHPLGTTLAACCNPWPGCSNPPCPTIEYRCWIKPYVSLELEAAVIVSGGGGGGGLIGDTVVVRSADLDGAIDLMQVTMLGSDVPEFSLADEAVEFAYVAHQALGEVELESADDGLTISNIGSSGQDGVSVQLEPSVKWSAGFDPATSPGPAGAAVEIDLTGSVAGTAEAPIGSGRYEVISGDTLEVRADFDPLGTAGYGVEILDDGDVVFSAQDVPEAMATVASTSGLTPQPTTFTAYCDGVVNWLELALSDDSGNLVFTGPFGASEGDAVRFTAEDPADQADHITGATLRATDTPVLALTGEGRVPVASDMCDNFDVYAADYLVGQGPWNPWEDDPAGADFIVTTEQALSAPQSLEIDGDDDAVRQFGGYTSGAWELTAWCFVPSALADSQYFILLNTYPVDPSDSSSWSLQLEFDGAAGTIENYSGSESLPLITDDWVEIRVVVDLDTDTQQVYYDGQLLAEAPWSAGVEPGGALEIAAIDLFASGSGTTVFYDDICLTAGEGSANPADVTGDGVVDVLDLLAVLGAWGDDGGPADVTGDGIVDVLDLLQVLSAWGS